MSRDNVEDLEPVAATAADDALRMRIEQLVREQLGCGEVAVAVRQGHVVLEGRVGELHEKTALERMLEQVDGIASVANRIAVRGPC